MPAEKFGRRLNFQPQRIRLDWVKRGVVVFVTIASERAGVRNRLPVLASSEQQAPALREPTFTDARIIEPIHINRSDPCWFGEIVFDPFFGAFVGPPMKEAIGVISRILWLALVVERSHIGSNAIV